MIETYIYDALRTRVIFGRGTFKLVAEEALRLGVGRVLVLSTAQQVDIADRVSSALGVCCAGRFSNATMHTPVGITDEAIALAQNIEADCIVSVGGGSTTGLGKAVSFRLDLPQIVIPTTYAGSEMTPILGETKEGLKRTKRDPRILPGTVIYDVDLTLDLPVSLSSTSGMNAIAHAVEALYAPDSNPIISQFAELAIGKLSRALPRIIGDPSELGARADALQGAWLAGMCLGSVSMGIHHKLCHTLGGTFNLPHAETHTVILPHSVAYVASTVPVAMAIIARALGAPDAPSGLYGLIEKIGAPHSLRELGMSQEDIALAAKLAVSDAYWCPRTLEEVPLRRLLERAYAGSEPLTE